MSATIFLQEATGCSLNETEINKNIFTLSVIFHHFHQARNKAGGQFISQCQPRVMNLNNLEGCKMEGCKKSTVAGW